MSADSSEPVYEVVWPLGSSAYKTRAPNARIADLSGKVVGELWDYLFRGDRVFAHLEQALRARFPEVRFVGWKEFGNTHGSDEHAVLAALPQRFRELGVDAVISGMGC